jgi:hypothetical protein
MGHFSMEKPPNPGSVLGGNQHTLVSILAGTALGRRSDMSRVPSSEPAPHLITNLPSIEGIADSNTSMATSRLTSGMNSDRGIGSPSILDDDLLLLRCASRRVSA